MLFFKGQVLSFLGLIRSFTVLFLSQRRLLQGSYPQWPFSFAPPALSLQPWSGLSSQHWQSFPFKPWLWAAPSSQVIESLIFRHALLAKLAVSLSSFAQDTWSPPFDLEAIFSSTWLSPSVPQSRSPWPFSFPLLWLCYTPFSFRLCLFGSSEPILSSGQTPLASFCSSQAFIMIVPFVTFSCFRLAVSAWPLSPPSQQVFDSSLSQDPYWTLPSFLPFPLVAVGMPLL